MISQIVLKSEHAHATLATGEVASGLRALVPRAVQVVSCQGAGSSRGTVHILLSLLRNKSFWARLFLLRTRQSSARPECLLLGRRRFVRVPWCLKIVPLGDEERETHGWDKPVRFRAQTWIPFGPHWNPWRGGLRSARRGRGPRGRDVFAKSPVRANHGGKGRRIRQTGGDSRAGRRKRSGDAANPF